MDISLSRVEAWLLCKRGSGRSGVHALCTVHIKTAAILVVSGRSTRVARRSVHTSMAKISVVHISMVCIQAWFALKPDAESGLCAYKPGFYPRLYRIHDCIKMIKVRSCISCITRSQVFSSRFYIKYWFRIRVETKEKIYIFNRIALRRTWNTMICPKKFPMPKGGYTALHACFLLTFPCLTPKMKIYDSSGLAEIKKNASAVHNKRVTLTLIN